MKIAILGFGTIGSGVYEIARANGIEVKRVLDVRETGLEIQTRKIEDIVDDPEIDVVVETMGGERPAYDFVKASMEAGKHVVTSNKALVAAFGEELVALAAERNLKFYFEAAVGGGIPIIRVIHECLACDEIESVRGILNGTTNYILTRMAEDGQNFEDALAMAQKLGYAEADPSADVEGWDTCRKTVILGWLFSGKRMDAKAVPAAGKLMDYKTVPTTGITQITQEDIAHARAQGKKIKLIGSFARKADGSVEASVKPELIGPDDPLYAVDDVNNAVSVKSKYMGTSMYYGPGAGKLPTATAVVADLMHI